MPRSGAARHLPQMAAVSWLRRQVQARPAQRCQRVRHVSVATSLGPALHRVLPTRCRRRRHRMSRWSCRARRHQQRLSLPACRRGFGRGAFWMPCASEAPTLAAASNPRTWLQPRVLCQLHRVASEPLLVLLWQLPVLRQPLREDAAATSAALAAPLAVQAHAAAAPLSRLLPPSSIRVSLQCPCPRPV